MLLKSKNPLACYKAENPQTMWKELAKKTGLVVQSLIRISHWDKKQIRNVKLDTYLIIKEKLNIDLLNDYE